MIVGENLAPILDMHTTYFLSHQENDSDRKLRQWVNGYLHNYPTLACFTFCKVALAPPSRLCPSHCGLPNVVLGCCHLAQVQLLKKEGNKLLRKHMTPPIFDVSSIIGAYVEHKATHKSQTQR